MARFLVFVGYGSDDSHSWHQEVEAETESEAVAAMQAILDTPPAQNARAKFAAELPDEEADSDAEPEESTMAADYRERQGQARRYLDNMSTSAGQEL